MKEKVKKIIKSPLLYALIICIIVQVIINTQMETYKIVTDTPTYVENYTREYFKGRSK